MGNLIKEIPLHEFAVLADAGTRLVGSEHRFTARVFVICPECGQQNIHGWSTWLAPRRSERRRSHCGCRDEYDITPSKVAWQQIRHLQQVAARHGIDMSIKQMLYRWRIDRRSDRERKTHKLTAEERRRVKLRAMGVVNVEKWDRLGKRS